MSDMTPDPLVADRDSWKESSGTWQEFYRQSKAREADARGEIERLRAEVERERAHWQEMGREADREMLRAEAAEAERDALRATVARVEALAERLGCRDRHDDAGEMVCATHGFWWPEGRQWCNGVTAFEAEVLALTGPVPAPEQTSEDEVAHLWRTFKGLDGPYRKCVICGWRPTGGLEAQAAHHPKDGA